jgi:hypothetical protein
MNILNKMIYESFYGFNNNKENMITILLYSTFITSSPLFNQTRGIPKNALSTEY